ncbi:MAG: hypothetical protein FWG80_04740 [Alphaproteobacteria bacterium]|nr:hypothetical protein [Alphaproteobacteria bacterium]
MENTGKSFTIRTFGRVHGKKLSERQQLLVDNTLHELRPVDIVDGDILEIGFGAGEHLLHLAKTYQSLKIIGAEPFINGVASLLSHITDDENKVKPEYKNIRIWPDDIRKLLSIIDCKFSVVYVLHPDPWPKSRHEKRRLLSAEFLNQLAGHLVPNGRIIIGTDHTDYFNWILEQAAKTNLKITNRDNFTMSPESGMDTRYQRKNKFGSDTPMYLVLSHSLVLPTHGTIF